MEGNAERLRVARETAESRGGIMAFHMDDDGEHGLPIMLLHHINDMGLMLFMSSFSDSAQTTAYLLYTEAMMQLYTENSSTLVQQTEQEMEWVLPVTISQLAESPGVILTIAGDSWLLSRPQWDYIMKNAVDKLSA